MHERKGLRVSSYGRMGLYTASASGIRGFNNNDADGPQGSEDDAAIHSRRQASEKCAFSEFWSQISHTRDTAASVGGRTLLRLLVGARGFEPPTSRSQTERTTRLCYAPKLESGNNRRARHSKRLTLQRSRRRMTGDESQGSHSVCSFAIRSGVMRSVPPRGSGWGAPTRSSRSYARSTQTPHPPPTLCLN